MMPSFDGLYVLASLDGAPLSHRDCAALGLRPADDRRGCVVSACDRGIRSPEAVDTAFLGHIDEQATLAATLGLDPTTAPADLVRAAVARFGDDAPSRVLGEWSFVHWDGAARTLTVMVSDTARDALLFATDGRRVAVAPHVRAFRRLDSVDSAPNGRGLLLHMGRATVRSMAGDETMLRGVRRVGAGTRVTIAPAGVTVGQRTPLPAPARWHGSFAEGIEAIDGLLRRILHEQLVRYPSTAVMLSGGLDSSLIAAFAAAMRLPSSSLLALTSAAPIGSGLPDERAYSQAVAEQAGIDMRAVVPAAGADAYLPTDAMLHALQQPISSPRHYVYDALYRAAAERGAQAIFDGSEGEWTVTGYPDDTGWRQRARDAAHRAQALIRRRSVQGAFHVRLSKDAIAFAQAELQPALRALDPVAPRHRRDDMWGYSPGIDKNLGATTTTHLPGIRRLLPFRDRRLLTAFAGMPYRFLTEGGVTRAPGRALLMGKVPEHVRLRERGLPFSPDYLDRIHGQAAAARDRLPAFARAGVGEWLDLAWLDGALARIAAADVGKVALDTVFEAQATATAAAFLAYWSSGDQGG